MYEPAIKTNEDIEEVKIVDLEDTLIQQTSKKKKKNEPWKGKYNNYQSVIKG